MQNTVKLTTANSTGNQATVSPSDYVPHDVLRDLNSFQANLNSISAVKKLVELSIETGGYVQLQPQYYHLPMLIGNDSQPVYLYEIVEAIDEFLDYDKIQEEYPTLSFSQIAAAVSFLRKAAQINSRNVDIDELEDANDARNPELIAALRNALADTEVACVFSDTE
jgi:hypothetical protein